MGLEFSTWKLHQLEKENPHIAEARRTHFAEIAHFLESWKKLLDSLSMFPHHFRFDYDIETEQLQRVDLDQEPRFIDSDPLFSRVLQHCPSVNKAYSALSVDRERYKQEQLDLQQRIASEIPNGANENFSKKIVRSCMGIVESNDPLYLIIDRDWLRVSSTADFHESEGIAKGNQDSLEHCKQVYEKLIDKYSHSEDIKQLVTRAKSLRELERALTASLQISQHKQEWVKGKCDWCP